MSTTYIEITQNFYNHGVIEYLIPRIHSNYKLLGLGGDQILITCDINSNNSECFFIPHFKKDDLINNKQCIMMKFDKDYVRVYTFPSSLRSINKQISSFDEILNKFADDIGFHMRYSFYKVVITADKLTSKSLKLKKSKTILVEKKSSTLRRCINIEENYDYRSE